MFLLLLTVPGQTKNKYVCYYYGNTIFNEATTHVSSLLKLNNIEVDLYDELCHQHGWYCGM